MENLNPPVENQVSAEAARSFFTEEGRVLSDIAGGSGFTFRRGDGWAINPETGEATYDPKFFEEKGYTPSQALFAAFHEIDHVTELAQLLETEEGKRTWEALKVKKQRQERTHLLWNFVTRDPAEKPFKPLYKKLAEQYRSPMEEGELEKKIKETKEQQSEGARQKAGYEAEHGVSQKDIADYAEEYRKIERYIEPLRQIFRRIIEQRKIPVRHLAALREEGVMIDPGLVAQTFMDVRACIENPKTMKDFEGTLIDENVPTNFEITVVADRTGSMKSGTKIPEQRRSSVLLMEALKEFSDMTEDQGPLAIGLGVRSEVLSFGDSPQRTEVLKPLSKELTERQRVGVFKSLAIADSGRNNEEVMLANILTSIQLEAVTDPTYIDKIKIGKLRKFVIILTDGIVGNFSATRAGLDRLRELGVVVAGVGMTRGGEDAVKTYAPNGRVCYDVSNLPKTLEEMLSEYLGTLSIDGNPQTVLQSEEV